MKAKKILLQLTVLCVVTTTACAVVSKKPPNEQSSDLKLTILQTSDIHNHASGYGPFIDYTPGDTNDNDSVLGGFSRLASIIHNIRAEQAKKNIPVLLIDSGDLFMGTTYDLTAADPIMLRFFNLMRYDAVTLGNHDLEWSPAGLAMLLSNAKEKDFNVPVLATNMITNDSDTADDGLEKLIDAGVISDKRIIKLPNGLNVGLMGLMGENADQKAPWARPVTFNHDKSIIQSYVDDLKDSNDADIVIALSHGGISAEGSGEDTDIANDVNGINIIASGHAHTATPKAFVKGNSKTIIFSPGEYGEWISRLDIKYNRNLHRIVAYKFTLIPVDDEVEGDAAIQAMVEQYHMVMNQSLTPLGVQLTSPISKTDFALEKAPFQETGIGNLIADSLRAVASSLAPLNDGNSYHIGLVGSGAIRDNFYPGKTGVITFSDVYNVLPLGISPDTSQPLPGYPLMSVYATSQDIYTLCEVALTVAPTMDPDFLHMNFSGIKIDYNPLYAPYFQGVRSVYVCPFSNTDPFCVTDGTWLDPADTRLYHIVVDLYALQMLNVVNSMLPPGRSIIPRDKFGNPINPANIMNYRIDADPAGGIQELKEWMGLLKFLSSAFPVTGEGIPSAIYGEGGSGMGRIKVVNY